MMRSMPHDFNILIERSIMEIPPTGTNPLGINSVFSPKREPKPAAIMTAVFIFLLMSLSIFFHRIHK